MQNTLGTDRNTAGANGAGRGRDHGWNGQTEMQEEANDADSIAQSQSRTESRTESRGYGAYGHGGVGHHAHGGYANGTYPEGRRTAESQRTLGANDVRNVNGVKYEGQQAPMGV